MGYWGKHHTEEDRQTMTELEGFDDKDETIDRGDHNILAEKRLAQSFLTIFIKGLLKYLIQI